MTIQKILRGLTVCCALFHVTGASLAEGAHGAHLWGQPGDDPVAAITEDGSLLLRGSLFEFATGLDSNHLALWRVEDDNESALALLQKDLAVTYAEGNLLIQGMVTSRTEILEPQSPVYFVFRKENAAGETVAALDNGGDLYLTGSVFESQYDLGPVDVDAELEEPLTLTGWGEIESARLDWNEAFPEPRDWRFGYHIYRSDTPEGGYERLNTSICYDTHYLDTGLDAGSTHYYQVVPAHVLGYEGTASNTVGCATFSLCAGIHPTGW